METFLAKHRAEYQTVHVRRSCYTCEETFTYPVFNVDHQEADVRGMLLCVIGFVKPNCEKPTVLRLRLPPPQSLLVYARKQKTQK